jgi:hypothetical protein
MAARHSSYESEQWSSLVRAELARQRGYGLSFLR